MTDLLRSFEVAAVEVEGRTVDVRLVPFGEVARVADPPDWEPYEEEWMPGCFDHQLNAANRIHANYEHMQGPTHVVGHGVSLRAVPGDGYHVVSTIHRTNAGDTTLELLNAGALPCVSLEARAVKSVKTAAGVIQRVKANLRGFAFTRQGAFEGAQVLAIREEMVEEQTLDAALLPHDMDPEVVERCRLLGLELPQRYEAHPANETGTPANTGTPADVAPAEDDNNTSSEDT